MSRKDFIWLGESFTACSCDCHRIHMHIKHIVPCCDVCYEQYIVNYLIEYQSGNVYEPEEANSRLKTRQELFKQFIGGEIDEKLLDAAIEKAYNYQIEQRKKHFLQQLGQSIIDDCTHMFVLNSHYYGLHSYRVGENSTMVYSGAAYFLHNNGKKYSVSDILRKTM